MRDAAQAVTGAFGGDGAASKPTIGDWMADRDARRRAAQATASAAPMHNTTLTMAASSPVS